MMKIDTHQHFWIINDTDYVWMTDEHAAIRRDFVPADLRPYFDTVFEAFGPSRVMFGSDWPVCRLRAAYRDWVQTSTQLTESLSDDEQSAFWGRNAVSVYQL